MAHSKLSFPVQAAVDCDLCEGHTKVDWYCLTCPANICEKCKVVHMSRKAFRKHEVISRDDHKKHQEQGKPYTTKNCNSHNQNEVVMMCITCAVPVCNQCILSTHNGHVFESLEAKLKRSKDKHSKYIEKLDEKSELINDQLMMHSCTQHFIAGERQCSKEKIIEARDAIIASVNAKSEKLIKQLETRMDKSKNEVSTIERKLNSALDKIEEAKKKAQVKMNDKSSKSIDHFLKEAERIDDMDINFSVTVSVPIFEVQSNQTTPKIGTLQFEDRKIYDSSVDNPGEFIY